MGRHVSHPDTSDLPFSYLIEQNNQTYLVPAVNLRSVGTIRDAQKWPKRDKRKDSHQLDYINFNLLSPYTIQKMLSGIEVLRTLQQVSGETSEEYSYQSAHIKSNSLKKGIQYYSMAINKFLGNSIIKRLENLTFHNNEEIRQRLAPTRTEGRPFRSDRPPTRDHPPDPPDRKRRDRICRTDHGYFPPTSCRLLSTRMDLGLGSHATLVPGHT